MTISKGHRERNTQAANYAAKYGYERSKIQFPLYIDFGKAEIKTSEDFLKLLDTHLRFDIFANSEHHSLNESLDQLSNKIISNQGAFIFILDNLNLISEQLRPSILDLCLRLLESIKNHNS